MYILSASSMSEIAACPPLLLLMKLQPYHLAPPLPPPVSNSSCLLVQCQPIFQLLYRTTVLFKVLCCRIKNVFLIFLCLFFIYHLCVVLCLLSHFSRIRLFATPWTIARQAPLSMGFPRVSLQPRDQTCVSCIGRWILKPLSRQESRTSDKNPQYKPSVRDGEKRKHLQPATPSLATA